MQNQKWISDGLLDKYEVIEKSSIAVIVTAIYILFLKILSLCVRERVR